VNAHDRISVKLHDIIPSRVLVTRQSARLIEPTLAALVAGGQKTIELDFSDVAGVTPSFLDETLAILEEQLRGKSPRPRVLIVNPPTRLSSKFEAVGRGHGLAISEEAGAWTISEETA
jgi:hypothetical protein